MRDLALRWLLEDPADAPGQRRRAGQSCTGTTTSTGSWTVLYSMLVVSHESHQHMLAAGVLDTYRALLGRADGPVGRRLRADVAVAGQLLDQDPPSPVLARARQSLAQGDGNRPEGTGWLTGHVARHLQPRAWSRSSAGW